MYNGWKGGCGHLSRGRPILLKYCSFTTITASKKKDSAINTRAYQSETKPNGFIKKCHDCNKPIYLHRGGSDRWRAFEPAHSPSGTSDEWVRHRCPSGLQDAELMSLIAPAGAKPGDLIARLKRLIGDFEEIIAQAEARVAADGA